MFHLNFKRRRRYLGKKFYLVSFFTSLGFAGIQTVWSIYMDSFRLSASTIGFIATFLGILSLSLIFMVTPIIEKYNKVKILKFCLITAIISYFLIGLFRNLYLFLGLTILVTILGVFRINCFDILFRDSIPNNKLNREWSFLYSTMNLGWVIGPLIGGFFLVKLGMQSVFIISSILLFLGLLIFFALKIKELNKHRIKIDEKPLKNIKDFLKNKKIHLPFIMSLGIYAWYPIIYIYAPLFIIHNKLSPWIVPLFISAASVPLIIAEYKIGKLSERLGFKFFFKLGYFGLAGISLLIFFIPNIYIQLLLLILGTFFMACLEPLQDSFFFKQIKPKEEEKYYPLYATATDLGAVIGRFSIAAVLIFLPNKFAYLTMFALMLIPCYFSLKIKPKLH